MRRFAVLVVLMTATACARQPLPPNASGAQLFDTFCAPCHGRDLGGLVGPPLGAGSEAAAMTDEFYRFTIEHGLGRMPSYRSALTDEQIDRVVAYLRQMQQE